MALQCDQRREALWREQVQQQAQSGLVVRQFCRDHQLSEPSFYAWRRTLQERDQAAAPAFVPVLLTPSPTSAPNAGTAPASSDHITIELRGGRVVHLPGAMATERLVALLQGLEAGGMESREVTL